MALLHIWFLSLGSYFFSFLLLALAFYCRDFTAIRHYQKPLTAKSIARGNQKLSFFPLTVGTKSCIRYAIHHILITTFRSESFSRQPASLGKVVAKAAMWPFRQSHGDGSLRMRAFFICTGDLFQLANRSVVLNWLKRSLYVYSIRVRIKHHRGLRNPKRIYF